MIRTLLIIAAAGLTACMLSVGGFLLRLLLSLPLVFSVLI